MLALVGVFYPYNRGSLYTALVLIYALTSGIAGYTASSFYKQLEGVNWVSYSHTWLYLKKYLYICLKLLQARCTAQGFCIHPFVIERIPVLFSLDPVKQF